MRNAVLRILFVDAFLSNAGQLTAVMLIYLGLHRARYWMCGICRVFRIDSVRNVLG